MATVRCFSYSGIVAVPWANNNQLATNAEYVLKEPYLGNQTFSVSGSAVSSSAGLAPTNTKFLRVEVDPGVRVHYEVTTQNATLRTATTDSPTLEGTDNVDFGPGYFISFVLAS